MIFFKNKLVVLFISLLFSCSAYSICSTLLIADKYMSEENIKKSLVIGGHNAFATFYLTSKICGMDNKFSYPLSAMVGGLTTYLHHKNVTQNNQIDLNKNEKNTFIESLPMRAARLAIITAALLPILRSLPISYMSPKQNMYLTLGLGGIGSLGCIAAFSVNTDLTYKSKHQILKYALPTTALVASLFAESNQIFDLLEAIFEPEIKAKILKIAGENPIYYYKKIRDIKIPLTHC